MVLDENSRVLWNEANRWGGGIYTATSAGRAANLELNGCKVSYNHADAIGGGAFQRYFGVPTGATSTLTVEDSEISHNTADGYGPGGISSYGDINAGLAAERIYSPQFHQRQRVPVGRRSHGQAERPPPHRGHHHQRQSRPRLRRRRRRRVERQ